MKQLQKRLGKRVAQERRQAGFTQAKLAEKVNVATETISRLETGAACPSLAKLVDVAAILEIDLHVLFQVELRNTPEQNALTRMRGLFRKRRPEELELIIEVATRILRQTGK